MNQVMPKADSPRNLTAQAYSKIRGEILACRLRPGQKLIISSLCKEHGYSLGAVREALSRLTSEGLVEAELNKGYRVVPITQSELEDLTRTRVLIECECLTRSIVCGDLKWESGIVSTLFELSRIDVARKDSHSINPLWAETHRRFHEALATACDSPWLLRLREVLYAQTERYRSFSVPLDRSRRDIHSEHKAIADAAIARDAGNACELMRRHLMLTTQILIDTGLANDQTAKAENLA